MSGGFSVLDQHTWNARLTSNTSFPRFSHSHCERQHLKQDDFVSLCTSSDAMATRLCEDDLLCPQCSDIYCLPVLLQCGHNVCKVCLHKFWELKRCRECPVCRAVSVPERPPINLALKIAAEEYQGQRTSRVQGICLLHEQKLTIFCQNDEEPICLVCQTSKRHKVHECCPVVEASRQKKVS